MTMEILRFTQTAVSELHNRAKRSEGCKRQIV